MGLERGTYGIEYDGNQKSSSGKLWLLPVVIFMIVLLLVLRGCFADPGGGVYHGDDILPHEPANADVEVERERLSIVAHFLNSWRARPDEEGANGGGQAAGSDHAEPALGNQPAISRNSEQTRISSKDTPAEVERLLLRVDELEDGGDLVGARLILQKLRLRPDAAVVRQLVEKRIGEINMALILSDKPMAGKMQHEIKAGDLVSKLTRRYKNTQAYIMRVNQIDRPERIRIGQKLWVLDNPVFELMIDKSEFKAVLLFNHRFFKLYRVGLGDPESVPSGTYEVYSRRKKSDSAAGESYSVLLRASNTAAAIKEMALSGAENESHIGMVSSERGMLFSQSEIEELYVLLPAGAIVTVIE